MNWIRWNEPVDGRRERSHGERLREPGNALEEHVPLVQEPDHHPLEQVALSDDDLPHLGQKLLDDRGLALHPFLHRLHVHLHALSSRR